MSDAANAPRIAGEAENDVARRMLLKAFSGPHLGAEAVLADGEYTVGRGAQCDLIFDDHAIAEEHLRLKVAGEKVHAEPLGDSRLCVGGKPTDGCTIPLGEYFTIGTTHLAVGFADAQWVVKPLPIINTTDAPAPASKEPEPAAAAEIVRRPISRRTRVFAWTSVAAVMALATWGAWIALTPTVQADASTPDRTGSLLDELIEKHAVAETVKSEKTERGWIVRGHLKTRETLTALERDCRTYLPESAIRLWDSETLATAAGEVLAAFRVAVAAAPGEAGEVVFQGRVSDAAQWARVRERIRHDVPALAMLTDNVLTGTGRYLRDSGGRQIEASVAPPPPAVTPGVGPYVINMPFPVGGQAKLVATSPDVKKPDAKSNPAPKSAQQTDAAKSSDVAKAAEPTKSPTAPVSTPSPSITYVKPTPVTPLPSPASAAPILPAASASSPTTGDKPVGPPVLAFQSVSVGAASWLRLADGTRVSVGGRIGGGYEIVSISDETIEAKRGETRVVYRLREGT